MSGPSASVPAQREPGPLAALVRHPVHGALPALLLVLTVGTGVVDAVSILSLGRVFVANMTGNVVFVGFALAGDGQFALAASLGALVGFFTGAAAGGHLGPAWAARRAFAAVLAVEAVLLVAALAVVAADRPGRGDVGSGAAVLAAALLALGMGLQTAAARRVGVPDLSTTVLTMTLAGLATDLRGGSAATLLRRVLAVLAMLAGAVVGALLVLHVGAVVALALAVAVVVGVLCVAALGERRAGRDATRT